MAKDATNITIGAASQIQIDDVEVGYTEGDVTFNRAAEIVEYKSGVPRKLIKQAVIEDAFSIQFNISEITGPNIALAALDLNSTATAAGTQNVTDQELTFAPHPNGTMEFISLDQPGEVDSYSVSLVETTGDVALTLNDDYHVDAGRGIIYRNPAGAITSGQTVKVTYSYDRLDYDEVALGKKAAITTKKVYFEHIGPDLQKMEVWIWAAQAAAQFELTASAENWWTIPTTLNATDDTANHPNSPFGLIRWTYPAAS